MAFSGADYVPFAYGMPETPESLGRTMKDLLPKKERAGAPTPQPQALDEFVPLGDGDAEPEPQGTDTPTAAAANGPPDDPNWSVESVYGGESTLLALHEDILDFWQAFQPTTQEATARAGLLERVRALVADLWPEGEVKPFGSYATGLFLPSSDVDLVVLGLGLESKAERVAGLRQIAQALRRETSWRADELEVVEKAKVPIVKFVDAESGVAVDICLETRDGLASSNLARKAAQQFPAFKYLVLVLKRWLAQRGLGDTYHGGVGSFLLQLLVIATLQNPPAAPGALRGCLGGLLLHFFEVFGLRFNYFKCGIDIAQGGRFFSKASCLPPPPGRRRPPPRSQPTAYRWPSLPASSPSTHAATSTRPTRRASASRARSTRASTAAPPRTILDSCATHAASRTCGCWVRRRRREAAAAAAAARGGGTG